MVVDLNGGNITEDNTRTAFKEARVVEGILL